MTNLQLGITVLVIMAGTMLTRYIVFILFRAGKPVPLFVKYLGKVLPQAVMGLLVVYCLRGVQLTASPHGAPEGIAILVVYLVHKLKKNALISIFCGTAAYMFLVQTIF